MRILGVDPGTQRLGYGILEYESDSPQCLDWGCLDVSKTKPLHDRLNSLHKGLRDIVNYWQPDHLAVEEPFVSIAKGAKSAIAIGQAQAVALILASDTGMEVYRYHPTQVKRAVGDYGGSTKMHLQRMVQVVLGMEPEPMHEDASDALAIAICHVREWSSAMRVSQR